jgi:thiol:disulfide interchange protein DsbD
MAVLSRTRFPVPKFLIRALPLLATLLLAQPAPLSAQDDEFLQPEDAYLYTATADEKSVTVEWTVTPGYYLYKKRMGISAATAGVTVGEPVYPKGEMHSDEYFGEQEIFRGTFKVTAPLKGANVGDSLLLKLKWQGCADAGLCYPPSEWDAPVKVVSAAATAVASADKLFGKGSGSSLISGEDEYLPVDEAFVLTADALSANNIQLNWRIAEGYYLYKERMRVVADGDTQAIGALVLPKGEDHYDEYFGNQEIYRESVDATFSVPPSDAKSVSVRVTYQGCADAGLCYPPETKAITISLEGAPTAIAASSTDGASPYVSEQDSFMAKLATGSLFVVVAIGYLGGLLMAFTPCVLPMVPILSGIIAGGGQNMSPGRGFLLSLVYVAGIAVVYVTMGVLAAYVGGGVNLQAIFNQPAILIPFALLFIVLAASMFGAFTIQMPSFIQSRLSDASNQQRAGTFVGVGVMGALSALIVSACVAPVLIGALTFIAKTGEPRRGRDALHQPRHGHAAAAGRRLGGRAAATRRRVDGSHQESLRRDVPRGVGLAAQPPGAGLGEPSALGGRRIGTGVGDVARAFPLRSGAQHLARAGGGRGSVRPRAGDRRGARRQQPALPHSAARREGGAPGVQALQDRGRPATRGRRGLIRRQGRDGGFLRGLVRVLHRDGTQDVHAAGGPGRARGRGAAAGRRHQER